MGCWTFSLMSAGAVESKESGSTDFPSPLENLAPVIGRVGKFDESRFLGDSSSSAASAIRALKFRVLHELSVQR